MRISPDKYGKDYDAPPKYYTILDERDIEGNVVNTTFKEIERRHSVQDPIDVPTFKSFERAYQMFIHPMVKEYCELYGDMLDKPGAHVPPLKINRNFQRFYETLKEDTMGFVINPDNYTLEEELFLLFGFTRVLNYYQKRIYKLPVKTYRYNIYTPLVTYFLIRYLPNAKQFLFSTRNKVYSYVQKQASQLVYVVQNKLGYSKEIILADVLYSVLWSAVSQRNPFNLNNTFTFYMSVFRNEFMTAFSVRNKFIHNIITNPAEIEQIVEELYPKESTSTKRMYADVIREVELEMILHESPALMQIRYNLSMFKNLTFVNELRRIILGVINEKPQYNEEYNLIKYLYYQNKNTDDPVISIINKYPIVKRILRSIPINTNLVNTPQFSEQKQALFFNIVQDILIDVLWGKIDIVHFHDVIESAASNFVTNITKYEYVDALTLTPFIIKEPYEMEQVVRVLHAVLKGSTTGGSNGKAN